MGMLECTSDRIRMHKDPSLLPSLTNSISIHYSLPITLFPNHYLFFLFQSLQQYSYFSSLIVVCNIEFQPVHISANRSGGTQFQLYYSKFILCTYPLSTGGEYNLICIVSIDIIFKYVHPVQLIWMIINPTSHNRKVVHSD